LRLNIISSKKYKIAISGAGISGTTSAFLLAEQGHQVTLFERAEKCMPVGAGILLQPSGQAVLDSLGLLEPIIDCSARIERLHAVTSKGHQLSKLSFGELKKGMHALGVNRGNLFSLLFDRCRAAGVEIKEGIEIYKNSAQKDCTYLFDKQNVEYGPFDFVIAADGSRSNLRETSSIKSWVKEYSHAALWAVSENNSVTDELYQTVQGTNILVGLLPTGNDQCSFFWGLKSSDWPQLRKRPIEEWKQEVIKVCPAAETSLKAFNSFDDLTFATYRQVWMPSWFKDKTIFLGDAAHSMSPHLGQGANFALTDAMSFCQALSSSNNFEEASSKFVTNRRKSIMLYWWLTRALTPFFQSDSTIRGWGRDIALPLMPKIPWVKNQMILSAAGLKKGLFT